MDWTSVCNSVESEVAVAADPREDALKMVRVCDLVRVSDRNLHDAFGMRMQTLCWMAGALKR